MANKGGYYITGAKTKKMFCSFKKNVYLQSQLTHQRK